MRNAGAQDNVSVSQGMRVMFYMMKPSETAFQTVEEVPDYVKKATPFFIFLILLELVISWILKGKPSGRLDDILTSMSAGVVSRLPSLLFRSLEVTSYIYIWENYRVFELPWDSPWTWYLTFLGVDFGYYWFHRMAHEINIIWAAHQVHHSSEDYNLSTALRQSLLQQYTSWVFYWPLALFIPPSVFAVHIQFNLLYQFWIHTEVIRTLGPLELVLNTPSHHRVHHGRNRYCIDKNYAGTLIIWDRIFGTFEAENEQVIYGLTHPIGTFEPFKVQFHHLLYIWTTFWATPGFCNKFSVLFKGPGWGPGKPRLGLSEEIPEVTGQEVPFTSSASQLLKIYAVIQFVVMLGFYEETFANTAVIRTLGPLELVLNTPSHHRVHHGRNRYCIDKNYAGTLIIWDRIFGTFEAENEQVIYGLTHPIGTFEPFKVQFHHLLYIWTTFWATPGFCNKFSVLFKGPGWGPGKPRLGLSEEIPEVTGQEVPFTSSASQLLKIYAVIQFVVMLGFYEETFANTAVLCQVTLLLRIFFIILSLTSIGFLLDQRPEAAIVETLRCLLFLTLYRFGHLKPLIASLSFALEIFFSGCIAFWGVRSIKQLTSGSWKKP